MVPNPPWATQAVADAYPAMQKAFQRTPQYLPMFRDVVQVMDDIVEAQVKEYGCGMYGCVFPTNDPGTVIKVTTDETEAQFAGNLSPTLVVPICTYYRADLPLRKRHQEREIYLLWRESAQHVGKLDDYLEDEMGKDSDDVDRVFTRLNTQHACAQAVYELLLKRPTRIQGPAALHQLRTLAMRNWIIACDEMAEATPELEFVGRGMIAVYQEQGIFFGDVHGGNIGMVKRDGKDVWVITDPGHVAVVDPRI